MLFYLLQLYKMWIKHDNNISYSLADKTFKNSIRDEGNIVRNII